VAGLSAILKRILQKSEREMMWLITTDFGRDHTQRPVKTVHDTPQDALDRLKQLLGDVNAQTYDDPDYPDYEFEDEGPNALDYLFGKARTDEDRVCVLAGMRAANVLKVETVNEEKITVEIV
jgi:hypothetical protein